MDNSIVILAYFTALYVLLYFIVQNSNGKLNTPDQIPFLSM